MQTPESTKKNVLKHLAVALSVIAAFAGGWLVSEVRHVNDVSPRMVWVGQWVNDLALLAPPKGSVGLKTPEQTQALVLSSLDIDSHTVALVYDTLPPDLKQRVDFWMPAARLIADAQQRPDAMGERRKLESLVDCVQAVQSQGSSVRACFHARQGPSDPH